MAQRLEELEKQIGITFKQGDLLQEALTHRSYLNERPNWPVPHNERLEYLGDAVLELAITEELFHTYPDSPEGEMTVLRASLVNYQMLYRVAQDISLDKYVLVSKGETKDNGRGKEVILANAIEALIGAIYLDQGFQAAKQFIQKHIVHHLKEIIAKGSYRDPKSELQEIIQERLKVTPTYRVLEESGPAHRKLFKVGAYFKDQLIAEGFGNSKQEAETEAARQALHETKGFIGKPDEKKK